MLYLFEQGRNVAIVEMEELKSNNFATLIKIINGCSFRNGCVTGKWMVSTLSLYKPLTDDDKVKYL
jgi:hypothetical protein